MVVDEIRRLWLRFENSMNHTHTIDSLSESRLLLYNTAESGGS